MELQLIFAGSNVLIGMLNKMMHTKVIVCRSTVCSLLAVKSYLGIYCIPKLTLYHW